ncbi:hypothetical protein [Streptomyces sp. NRRL B-1347]|uniref:hypothetical protein n=1 Tax=Streptomyces sp. NRRL B-1347 TaxID=1476877 RepID=UPI0004CB64B6|nr:hypothetical protein [Streptomyces sp. NRRL B-1347]
MTARPGGSWPRTVHALWLADTRRRLNLLAGTGPSARRRRSAARVVVCAGAAAVLGTLVVLGRTLGVLAPPGPAVRTDLATWTWTPVALWFLFQLFSAEPAKARALVSPPDASVLRTLPVSRAQLVTARLVVPAAGIALGLLTAAAAIAVPWLAAGAEGRAALPVLAVHAAGAAASGVALRVALVTALMVRVVRVPQLPRLAVALVGGGLVGVVAAPFVRALGGGSGPSEQDVARLLGDAVTASRPQLWTELHEPGALAPAAAGYTALTLLLAAFAVLRVRATVRRDATATAGSTTRAATGATGAWPASPYRAVWRVTWLRLLRGHPETVGGLLRLQRFGAFAGAVCAAVVVTNGQPVWQLPPAAVGALFVAVALITTSEVVQVCGIEADRECWDALRQSPRPTGAWAAAKAWAATAAVGAAIGPFALGAAALCGVRGAAAWTQTLLALAAVACGAGCATVLTYFCVPRAETFADGRVTRAPAADVTEGVFVALLTVPVTAGAGLCQALADGTAARLAHAVLLAAALAGAWAVLRAVAARDLAGPKAAPAAPAPADSSARQQKAGALQ